MAFRGDIAQIPLSNILQALMMNGQEGILTLESEGFQARLFILQIGIRPLNYETDTPDLLKRIVLKQKLLTESQFQNIFSTWVPGSSHPGDFLISRRILSPETVENELRQQLEDFIFEIFLIPKLKYEFSAGADSTEYELFAPGNLGQALIYNANGILMETVRREDEWKRFQEEISSPIEIYELHDVTDEDFEKIPLPQEKVQEVRTLVDGENSVSQIIDASILSGFDVYEILWSFAQAKLISPLDLEDKLELANHLRKSLRPKDAISIYRSILLNDPDNTAIRRQLITLLIKCKAKGSDLVDHYLHLASQLSAEDPDQSRQYLENALSIAPHNIQALEKLFELHAVAGKNRDALNVARTLVAAAKTDLDPEIAINLLYKMINFYPEEVSFYHEIAELQVSVNDLDGAVECLKSAGDIYRQRSDYQKLRRTYEKIVRLRPSESNYLKRIKEEEKRAQRSRTYLIKFVVASLVIGFVAGLGLVIGINEHRARLVYAEGLHSMVIVLKHHDEFAQAKKILSEFKRAYPWTTVCEEANTLAAELDELELKSADKNRTREDARRYAERTKLQKLRIQCESKNYTKAIEIMKSLDLTLLPDKGIREVKRLRAEIMKYMETAREFEKKAREALKEGDYVAAHRLRQAILYNYADSPEAKNLLIPVYVKSTPPGVNVIVDGKILGKTPMLLQLEPDSRRNIVLARPGYKLLSLNRALINGEVFRPIVMPVVEVTLSKELKWAFDAGAPIECFPVVDEERVFVGTRSGLVFAVDRRSGAKVWEFEVEYKMDVTGGLRLWDNLLYFGSSNGLLYVLNARTGAKIHAIDKVTKALDPIKEAPTQITDTPITFVNCSGRALSAVNVTTGEVDWVKYFKQRRLVGPPLARGGHVYITTDTGTFLKISERSGEIVKSYRVADPSLTYPGQVAGRFAYFFDGGHDIHAIDLNSSSKRWTFAVRAGITAAPTADTDYIVVPARGEIICLSAATGQPVWRIQLQDEVTTHGRVYRNVYLCGTRGGRLLSLDLATGAVQWSYKTTGRTPRGFISRPTIKDDYLFIGSESGKLYSMAAD